MNNKEPNAPASEPVAPGFTEFGLGGIRNCSGEFAHDLIVDATEWVEAIIENKKVNDAVTENPLLVATHAMAALLDFELGRIVPILERGCAALEQIAGSLDFLAARPDGVNEVPTDEERTIIYRALEADYMVRSNSPSIREMDAALLRFKKLAGF